MDLLIHGVISNLVLLGKNPITANGEAESQLGGIVIVFYTRPSPTCYSL